MIDSFQSLIHKYNYSDLPVFDMFFGTFKNPKAFQLEAGFYPGASNRVVDMMLFKEISNNGNTEANAATALSVNKF